jgi:hypothetical protein
LIATFAAFAGASVAAAQQPADDPLQWRVRGGVVHQLETDIDTGGEYDVSRAGFDVQAIYEFNPDLTLDAQIGYEFSTYGFSGSTGFGGLDPWDDIHTVRVRALFNWRLTEEWAFVGGPVLELSAENGADIDDGFAAGGVISATYKFNDDLTFGGGVLLISEIEKTLAAFPVFIVNWRINDFWTIRNNLAPFGGHGGGIEAVWNISDEWDVAFGAQYQWRQFKLDDTGSAPNGVGEDLSVPFYVNARWNATSNVTVSMAVGVSVAGEFELQNSSGDTILDENFDPTAIFALSGSITF